MKLKHIRKLKKYMGKAFISIYTVFLIVRNYMYIYNEHLKILTLIEINEYCRLLKKETHCILFSTTILYAIKNLFVHLEL